MPSMARTHKPVASAAHSFTRFHHSRRGGIRFIQFGRYTVTISRSRSAAGVEKAANPGWEARKSDLSDSTPMAEDMLWTLVYLVAWPMAALAAIVLTRPVALTLADWLAATLISG